MSTLPSDPADISFAPSTLKRAPGPRSRADIVESELEHMILTGALPAGERVNENALAARLQVSRGPIREAFRRLQQMGLVAIVLNQGVFVRKVSLKEAFDVYDIRASLARLAGRRIVRRISSEQLDDLRARLSKMDEAGAGGDVGGYFRLNLEFHEALFACTGNRRLAALYLGLVKELHLFRWHSFFPLANLAVSNAEHHRIVEAIAAGDGPSAGRAFEHHVLVGKKRMLAARGESEIL